MSKVLICYEYGDLGMSDFTKPDYTLPAERVKNECHGKFPNFGNKVWLQGIVSAITGPGCEYGFGYEKADPEKVNGEYDCVLMPLANCFHKNWIPWLKTRGDFVRKLKIPVFVIACGAQANSYDDINKLIDEVGGPAKEFIDSVYATGGEFALRGYFTAEFFEKLGYHSAVVTGCPSLFQMGRDLYIPETKVPEKDFHPVINGSFQLPLKGRDIDKSDFICQGNYGKYLYDPDFLNADSYDFRKMMKYVKRGNYSELKALAEGRIKMFADIGEWMNYFIAGSTSFSFGSRIHGSVMPILSGVPAMVYTCDSRTREMAEFFDIPLLLPEKAAGKKYSLYELYCSADYSLFNKKFSERFDTYENFLKECGITDKVNANNIFMSRENTGIEMPVIVNRDELDRINSALKKNKPFLDAADLFFKIKKRGIKEI